MSQTQYASEVDEGSEELAIVSVERTPEEKRDAYTIEWREPANPQSWVDQIKSLF